MTSETTVAALEPTLSSRSVRLETLLGNARVALLAFGFVVSLAASEGGYRPSAWGWTALVAWWLAALGLVLGRGARPGRRELVGLGGLAAFSGWMLLSLAWTSSTTKTVLEVERAAMYVAVVAMLVLLVRPRNVPALLAGTWAGVSVVALYALATRLFPERLGSADPLAGYRLAEPIGYWNALGIFCMLGALLAVGLAARSESYVGRALAAASLVVLVTTQYFTFSRGAWLAVGVGAIAMVAVDRRRLQLLTVAFALAPWAGAAVWLASRSHSLVVEDAPLRAASHDGHRLAAALVMLAVAAAFSAAALRALDARIEAAVVVRRALALAVVVALVAGLAGVVARYGSPTTLVRHGYSAFKAPEPRASTNLNERVFDLSGNGRDEQWRVAWKEARLHPWLGSGAGTYEEYWLRLNRVGVHARDAHNLYLEVLAELGPFGLALLLLALGTPLVAAAVARRAPLVSAAAGAYVAFLAHAAIDRDWETPAVTVTALCCAAVLLVAARRRELELTPRARAGGLAAVVALSVFAFVAAIGNSAAGSSADAVLARDWAKAEAKARTAKTWMPWSADPWRHLGEAELGRGERARAAASFRKALAKEPRDWSLWYDLALATRGREQARAVAETTRLNPRGSEVRELREELGR